MQECLLYNTINHTTLQCKTCCHFCKIQNDEVGLCGVRKNINGTLYLLIYEKSAAFHIDPIEKKPLFHFLPGSRVFSFGTFGCNFRCDNCQNFDLSQILEKKQKVKEYKTLNWGHHLTPKDIVHETIKNHCPSIAYTYNEPTIFLEYALDTMKLAKKNNIKNVWVSNGFMSDQTLDLILPYLDAINVDLKSMDDSFYKKNCGGSLGPVLNNLKKLVQNNVWLEITTLIIPTLSDKEEMFTRIAKFIKNELEEYIPWHISAFSGTISWKLKDLPQTPLETIQTAYRIGKETGLKYVYVGNVLETNMENTYCPRCTALLIERERYVVTRHDRFGQCACGFRLHGIL